MSIATIYWGYTNDIERTALLKTMIHTESMQLSKQQVINKLSIITIMFFLV